jgi:hypothetical protein
MIFSLICVIAIGVPTIVNVAVAKTFTWAAYPTLGVTMAWLLMLPVLLLKKHGVLLGLTLLTLTIWPFLYLIEKFSGGDWFVPIGLPAAAIGVVTLWLAYAIFRFIKWNMWYKLALITPLLCLLSQLINALIYRFADDEQSIISIVTNVFACVVLSLTLVIIGYATTKRQPGRKR